MVSVAYTKPGPIKSVVGGFDYSVLDARYAPKAGNQVIMLDPPLGGSADDTAKLHAARDAAPVGAILKSQPGLTYNIIGLTFNKAHFWDFTGSKLFLLPGIIKEMVTVTAPGVRIFNGEFDGNRANQSGAMKAALLVNTTSNFKMLGTYVHSVHGAVGYIYDSDNVRIIQVDADDIEPTQHGIFAESITTARSRLRIIDFNIDRSGQSSVTGYGVSVHGTGYTYSNVKVTGEARYPVDANSTGIGLELWHNIYQAAVDFDVVGSGTGASFDMVDTLSGRVSVRNAKNMGVEVANACKRVNLHGVVDGQGRTGAGLSMSNVLSEEVNLDLTIDNCSSRCMKIQQVVGAQLKGYWRMRASGQAVGEIINCDDLHLVATCDGRNDAGAASAQDCFDIDHSRGITGQLRISHFTRLAFGLYSFSVGSKVDNIFMSGSVTDCPAVATNLGFSQAADLGTNLRFRVDTDGGIPAVSSAAALAIPLYSDIVSVTGTTGITSITAATTMKGRVVTLVFAGALVVTSGNNLKLNGNFTSAAPGTALTLISDGTNWYEIGRKP